MEVEGTCAYLVEGEGVAEDEVDGALDVAVPVVVPAQVVVQRVLRAQEVAPHERRVVRRDSQRHALLAQRAGPRHGGRVLGNRETDVRSGQALVVRMYVPSVSTG
jgi:hypothetical protein